MTHLPDPRGVAEFYDVDRRRFEEEIRPSGQPAVLRQLARHWPAVAAGMDSPQQIARYLLAFEPGREIQAILGPPSIKGRFFYSPDLRGLNFVRGSLDLATFLARLIEQAADPEPHAIAVQSEPVTDLLPGFAEANALDLLADATPRIWIGNRITVATHYDIQENIGVVLAGRRRFTLFPPDQVRNLYIGPLEFTPAGTPVSMVNLAEPDLAQFPRYAEAAAFAQSAELLPGDAIYIPYHWWHGVESLDAVNVLVNFWWNEAPAGAGDPFAALMIALHALRNLPDDQRAVWRLMFDELVFCAHGNPAAHLPPDVQGVLGPADAAQLARMGDALASRNVS